MTVRDPLAPTVPSPLMEVCVALAVSHDRVADCPAVMAAGVTVILAVGVAGGVGGGGGAAAIVFLWHPLTARLAARQSATETREGIQGFTVNLLLGYAVVAGSDNVLR